ncbi:type II toxin-antitoxin system RelE/ParE family toxin [Nocardia donostiensis]|uniref:type II toxin-antitoxin system RelE/ParE family toxin n=1 Tax=Nocardia donostiensis TaxID=1538463 RepID=UPI0034A09433
MRAASDHRAQQGASPRRGKKLVGSHSDWRIRIGQYRIVYEIDDGEQLVTIYTVAKRSDVYR